MELNLHNLAYRHYGISVKYYRTDDQDPYKRIDYDTKVEISAGEAGWILSIGKENVFFNQHEPDAVNEILSSYITRSLYPVQTEVNNQLINVKGITNHQEIIKRWQSYKNQLTDKYAGNTVDEMVAVADAKFNNRALIEKSMKYDMFWNLFFHPKHIRYGEQFNVKTDLHLALAPYQYPVRFTGVQTFNPEKTSYNSILVNFNSDEMDVPEYLIPSGKAGRQHYQMKLNVIFDLDATHLFPMHTRAYFEIYYKDTDNKIQSDTKIHFTMYQSNTDQQDNQADIRAEELKNKKSKLMKFFDALVGD